MKPILKLKSRGVCVSAWENKTPDGKTFYKITPDKMYLNENGEWKTTSSFGERDILILAELLKKMYRELNIVMEKRG